MTALVERVVWVSLATSLLLLPLLGLSGAIRRRYRAGSCYLLWLVLALRRSLGNVINLFGVIAYRL